MIILTMRLPLKKWREGHCHWPKAKENPYVGYVACLADNRWAPRVIELYLQGRKRSLDRLLTRWRMYVEEMASGDRRQTDQDKKTWDGCNRRVATSQQHRELYTENSSDLADREILLWLKNVPQE